MENEIEILSSAANVNVKVLVSFFLCESGRSAATQAIHKEKFNVPIHLYHSAAILESLGNKGFVFALSLPVQPHIE